MNLLIGAIVILANNAASNTGIEIDLSSLLVGVLGGIIASLLAYLGHSLYVIPKQRYNELRGKIVECLVYYANVYATVLPLNETSETRRQEVETAKKEIRHLAAEIYAYSYSTERPHVEPCCQVAIARAGQRIDAQFPAVFHSSPPARK